MRPRRKTRVLLVLSLVLSAWPALAQPGSVVGFPDGTVESLLESAVATWNRLYGATVTLESVQYVDRVRDVAGATDLLLDPAVFPQWDEKRQVMRVVALGPQDLAALPPERVDLLRENIRLNLAVGDFLFKVRLRDLASGATFESLNTMRPSGRGFSGTFLGAARGEPGPFLRSRVPNTQCDRRVLTTYLWGSDAEFIEVCVKAFCEGPVCVDCLITEITPMAGFFAELKTRPETTQPPVRGQIVQNCCFGGVAWAWATGFKKVKVAADKVSLEVEGTIGQGTNGFFSVEECCTGGSERPPSEGASTPGSRPPGSTPGGDPPPPPTPLPDCRVRPKVLRASLIGGPRDGRAAIKLTSEAFSAIDHVRADPYDLELELDDLGNGTDDTEDDMPELCMPRGCLDDFTFTVTVGYTIYDDNGVPKHSGYETLRLGSYSCGKTQTLDGTIDFQDGAAQGTIYVLTELKSECVAACEDD